MVSSRRGQVATGDEVQFIVFRVGTVQLAVNIFQVARILRLAPLEPLADAPPFIEGGLPYQDRTVPVLDLRKRLGLPVEAREETRVMILDADTGQLGVVVDQVHEVIRVDTRQVTPLERAPGGLAPESVGGAIARNERTIVVLQAGRLLNPSERQALREANR